MHNSLVKCKICFVNLNSTIHLDTFNLNYLIVLYFNINNELVNNELRKYLSI